MWVSPLDEMKKIPFVSVALISWFFLGIKPVFSAGITMFLTPEAGNYVVGDKISVVVNLDSGGQQVISADARLSFDPKVLQVRSIVGSLSDFSYIKKIDNDKGSVVISLIMKDIFSDGVVVDGELAQIVFEVVGSGEASIDLVYDPQDKQQDSSVALLSAEGDQLTAVRGAHYTLALAKGTPVETITPIPTVGQTGAPTPTITEVGVVEELPDTGNTLITYVVAGMAGLLLLAGTRLALIKA